MPAVRWSTETPFTTFGGLRTYGLGFVVRCRRCDHGRTFTHKAGRFLIDRLPDTLELSCAVGRFRCSVCNYDLVEIQPTRERH